MGVKEYVKENFRAVYDVPRAIHHGIKESKERRQSEAENRVCHTEDVPVDAPLSKMLVLPVEKRLNIVISRLDAATLEDKKQAEILLLAVKIAAEKKYKLRIVSRNNLANPKVFSDFLAKRGIKLPENISFYTDSSARISSSVYRLEVTEGDVFFTEDEINKLKGWAK